MRAFFSPAGKVAAAADSLLSAALAAAAPSVVFSVVAASTAASVAALGADFSEAAEVFDLGADDEVSVLADSLFAALEDSFVEAADDADFSDLAPAELVLLFFFPSGLASLPDTTTVSSLVFATLVPFFTMLAHELVGTGAGAGAAGFSCFPDSDL